MEACLRARNFRSPPVPPKQSISIARLTSSGSCTGILLVLTSWSLFSHFYLVVELPLCGAKLSRGHVLSLLSLSVELVASLIHLFHNSISWTGTPLWPLSIYLIHSMKKKKKIFPELSRRVKKRRKERLSKMHRRRYYIPSEPSWTP